jgi:hypothetical protein
MSDKLTPPVSSHLEKAIGRNFFEQLCEGFCLLWRFNGPGTSRHVICSVTGSAIDSQYFQRSPMEICKKCGGAMVLERAIDLEVGLSILYFACLNCGKRIQAECEPRPLVSHEGGHHKQWR